MKSNVLGDKESEGRGPEYYEWSEKIKSRDNWLCQACKYINQKVESHHLNAWHGYPLDRYVDLNGICLCQQCHQSFHKTHGYTGKTTYFEFQHWLEMRKFFIDLLSKK